MGVRRRTRRDTLRIAYRHMCHANEIIKNEYGDTLTDGAKDILSALRILMLDLEDEMSGTIEPRAEADDASGGDRELALAQKAKEVCKVRNRMMLFGCPNCGRDAMGTKRKDGSIDAECPTCRIMVVTK